MKLVLSVIVFGFSLFCSADCGSEKIKIYTSEPEFLENVCDSIASAKKFFENLNIESDVSIELHISDSLQEGIIDESITFERVFGFVHPETLIAYMASWQTTQTMHDNFHGYSFQKAHYDSIIAHEVGHIISLRHYQKLFNMELMPKEQAEYLSYALQLEAMPKELRDELVDNFPWPMFEDVQEINLGYHDLNPYGFAVKSYLYFNTPLGLSYANLILQTQVPRNPGYTY